MRTSQRYIIPIIILCVSAITFASRGAVAVNEQDDDLDLEVVSDSIAVDTASISDSLGVLVDSVKNVIKDSALAQRDTVPRKSRIRREKVDIDNVITINTSDSLILLGRNKALMYGDGKVNYGDLKLEAAQIEVDMRDKTVYAVGRPDSVGELQGKPVFEQGGS